MKLAMKTLATLAAVALTWPPTSALAGAYADDFSKCLVSSTSTKDKTDLVRWIFANAALHPEVSSIASVSPPQRSEMTRTVGQLIERLLVESCRTQLQAALKYEGPSTFELSFQVLGQVAMRELITDPSVAKGFSDVDRYIDKEKLKALKP